MNLQMVFHLLLSSYWISREKKPISKIKWPYNLLQNEENKLNVQPKIKKFKIGQTFNRIYSRA